MLCSVYTLKDHFLTEISNLCISRIILSAGIPVVWKNAVKLLRSLDCVRSLCEEEPTLKIAETMSFEHKLHSTLTTNLVHICIACELSMNVSCTYACAYLINGSL